MLLGYEQRFLSGMALTGAVALLALALALILGGVVAAMKLSRSRLLRAAGGVYTTAVRGVPELLLILFVYFQLQIFINAAAESLAVTPPLIPPFWAGVAAIGVVYGAHIAENFRGAYLAVSPLQLEAGRAFALPRARIFWRIIAPQMARHALPVLRNNWQVLLKATALVSVIGLADDMMAVAKQAATKTKSPFLFYMAVAGGYLVFTFISEHIFNRLEARARRGEPATASAAK